MTRWLLGVVLFGCGSSKQEPPPPPTPVAADVAPIVIDADWISADPPIDAPVVDPYAGYPARLERPASPCTLQGPWHEQPHGLALAPGGKPYAEVFQVKQATVVAGDDVFVQLETESMRLTGYVDKKQLVLHAAAPMLVERYAVPGPKLPLRFLSAKADRITFEVPLPKSMKAKASPRADAPCSDLALDDDADFDPRDALDEKTEKSAHVVQGKPIPLSIEPGKPPIVTVRYDRMEEADILATQGKLVRVALHTNALDPGQHVMLIGWIPASLISDQASGFGGSWATGGDRSAARKPSPKNAKRMTCRTEIPLAVELAGERKTVGVLLADVDIDVLPGDDFVEILPVRPHAELARGGRWLVSEAALAACHLW